MYQTLIAFGHLVMHGTCFWRILHCPYLLGPSKTGINLSRGIIDAGSGEVFGICFDPNVTVFADAIPRFTTALGVAPGAKK